MSVEVECWGFSEGGKMEKEEAVGVGHGLRAEG